MLEVLGFGFGFWGFLSPVIIFMSWVFATGYNWNSLHLKDQQVTNQSSLDCVEGFCTEFWKSRDVISNEEDWPRMTLSKT